MDAVAFSHIGNGRDSHEDNYLLQGEYIRPNQQRRMSPNSGEVAYSVARGHPAAGHQDHPRLYRAR